MQAKEHTGQITEMNVCTIYKILFIFFIADSIHYTVCTCKKVIIGQSPASETLLPPEKKNGCTPTVYSIKMPNDLTKF